MRLPPTSPTGSSPSAPASGSGASPSPASSSPSPSPWPHRSSLLVAAVTVVLAAVVAPRRRRLADVGVDAGRRRRGRRRSAGCSTCRRRRLVVERPHGGAARRRAWSRPRRRRLDEHRSAPGSGLLTLALYVPVITGLAAVACLAPDVGRAGRRARRHVRRPRRAAGPRRLAVPRARGRHPARPRRPRPGAGGGVCRGVVRVRRRRRDVRLASATRGPVDRRRAVRNVPGPRHAHRRLVVRAAHDDDDVARARASPPTTSATSGCSYIGDPRVLPAAPHDLGDGVAYALTGARGAAHRRSLGGAGHAMPTTSLARRSPTSSSGATQRGGRLLAPYAIRYIVVPHIDGGQSTASDPIDPPIGLTRCVRGAARPAPPVHVADASTSSRTRRPSRARRRSPGRWPTPPAASGSAELVRRDLSDAPAVLSGTLDGRIGVR